MLERKRLPVWLGLAALVIGLDQLTKAMIMGSLAFGEVVPIMSFFNIKYTVNPGAAWSFLADAGGWQRWFFIALAVGISTWLVFMIRQHQQERWAPMAFSLILGGAIGNVIDRIYLGVVVDFLDFHAGGYHFPAFNVADSAITLGVIVMLADQFFVQPKKHG